MWFSQRLLWVSSGLIDAWTRHGARVVGPSGDHGGLDPGVRRDARAGAPPGVMEVGSAVRSPRVRPGRLRGSDWWVLGCILAGGPARVLLCRRWSKYRPRKPSAKAREPMTGIAATVANRQNGKDPGRRSSAPREAGPAAHPLRPLDTRGV